MYFRFDEEGKGIRPRQRKGIREQHIYKYHIHPFTEIEFEFTKKIRNNMPHTEDYFINQINEFNTTFIRPLECVEIKELLEKTVFGSVKEIFKSKLHENKYILENRGIRSIGTINPSNIESIDLYDKDYEKISPKITFMDLKGNLFENIPITDLIFRKDCERIALKSENNRSLIEKEAEKIIDRLNEKEIFLRLGLSRAFSPRGTDQKYHFILVTGIYGFPK